MLNLLPRTIHVAPVPRRWLFGASLLVLTGLAKPAPISNAGIPNVVDTGTVQPQAIATARTRQRQEQERQIRPDHYDLSRHPISDGNERHWRNLLWTTAIVQPQQPFVIAALDRLLAMTSRGGLSRGQARTLDMAMQVSTQLYLSNPTGYANLGQRFGQIIEQSPDAQWVAMALAAVARAGLPGEQLRQLSDRVRQRFPNWSENLHLHTTLKDVAERWNPPKEPPLRDLFAWTIASGQPQAYVICQSDRRVLCQMILRDRNGKFLRETAPAGQVGRLWSVPLLLRSVHNLSWNFYRGNTPQGIYRMEGLVPQPDDEFFRAYGQFALVNLFVPFEPGAKEFLPKRRGSFNGSIADYLALVPPSWRGYWGIQQSYWAGKAGRSLFRIHGSGESPDFFSGKDGFPDSYSWNPTIGCLSALELYNEAGKLIQADMPKILNGLIMAAGRQQFTGYLVVVNLTRDSQSPIALEELEAALPPPQKLVGSLKPTPKAAPTDPLPGPAADPAKAVSLAPSLAPIVTGY